MVRPATVALAPVVAVWVLAGPDMSAVDGLNAEPSNHVKGHVPRARTLVSSASLGSDKRKLDIRNRTAYSPKSYPTIAHPGDMAGEDYSMTITR
ncbi:hypothetical protein FRC10_003922 [Ceratobasidium sp. 414]|nr:hypothetical protein FRC10_003922 [Ceratobasidium sp. 414]